ncbi:hypothetical protein LSCM4_04825 [Leishmania orientalis]|uniref:Transmembrane protein n=1 Tax=Leishmania orientalis TaxID=2249476 RepID=A0A836GYK4_9TRYP|nr:hypothetical protein LSCM4_04825 [Leishmania orientalis]
MVAWGPLQRQLMAYVTRHPKFQQAVRKVWQRMAAHSGVQRAKQSVYATFEKASAKVDASTEKSTLSAWRRRLISGWYKHKPGVVSFIAANFMVILMLLQFSPMMWHSAKRGVQYLTEAPSSVVAERKVKRRGQKADEAEEPLDFKTSAQNDSIRSTISGSVAPPQTAWGSHTEHGAPVPSSSQSWQTSYSLFDDTVGTEQVPNAQQSFTDMHKDLFRTSDGSALITFDTSFLVKMGDETTFTSSLEREVLTGSVSSRSL